MLADSSVAGRVNINPLTTAGGLSTINGQINTAVPEPSSIVLSGLLACGLLGLVVHTRRAACKSEV